MNYEVGNLLEKPLNIKQVEPFLKAAKYLRSKVYEKRRSRLN